MSASARSRRTTLSLCVLGILVPLPLLAGGLPAVELDTIEVTAERSLQDRPASSTEGYVTADQLEQRPISRSGDLLEFVPGLIVTQHSGEGKANQYFLRGFNLDHGTDFYTEVDGLPVNMRSHGHGQGYADINFIIPELIGELEYRKGPYYADVGDFAAAGSARLRYVDELPRNVASYTLGEDGYHSALLAGSPSLAGGKLLLGLQGTLYDGPYALEEDTRKFAGIARFNQGDEDLGYTVSLAGYSIDYTAPDQIPLRAVQNGRIDELGFIDPSDGGDVRRFSLNGEWRGPAENGSWRMQGYALYYRLDLFSDFTYFATGFETDIDGNANDADAEPDDQFEQADERGVYGFNARRNWKLPFSVPSSLEVGVQSRHDEIQAVGLYLTHDRRRDSTVREDGVRETSAAIYATSTQQWSPWFRSQFGLRADSYFFDVDSDLAANSGSERDAIFSPKMALVFGPWNRTELYLNYGQGFHSNDARGTTIRINPADPAGERPESVDPLVKARGGEIGVTSAVIPTLKLTASLWALNFDSELVYVGDAGASEPSSASRRRGVEVSAYYTPVPWLVFDADYAYSHARLDVNGAEDRIPNSIEDVIAFGITIPETRGWEAGLRLRRLGEGPLIEDNSARSRPTTVVSAQAGYRLSPVWRAKLSVLNLLDSDDNDITYFYTSRLPGEPAEGVDDIHFHPVEPRAVRLSLNASF